MSQGCVLRPLLFFKSLVPQWLIETHSPLDPKFISLTWASPLEPFIYPTAFLKSPLGCKKKISNLTISKNQSLIIPNSFSDPLLVHSSPSQEMAMLCFQSHKTNPQHLLCLLSSHILNIPHISLNPFGLMFKIYTELNSLSKLPQLPTSPKIYHPFGPKWYNGLLSSLFLPLLYFRVFSNNNQNDYVDV